MVRALQGRHLEAWLQRRASTIVQCADEVYGFESECGVCWPEKWLDEKEVAV